MPTPIQWPPIGGATFQIPTSGETNWPVLTNFLVALGSAQGTAAQKVGVRVATTTPVTVSSTNDAVVGVDLAIAGPSVVDLPAGVPGQWICIVDRKGDAGTNGITLTPNGAETIAGLPTLTLNQNGASLILAFDGTGNWMIIAQAAGEGSGGGISRAALDAATPNWVIINNGSGMLSQEQYLSAVRGGLGVNAAAFTGFLRFNAGVATASALVEGDLPSGINVNKLGSGLISNTEFDTLNGASSNIQNQLDTKQALDADLTALAALGGTGWAVRTAVDTWTTRTLTAASTKVSITNPGGVAGDPALDVVEANLTLQNLGGTLTVAKGGTGATDADTALTNLLPTQAGQAGKVLYTNGTLASWLATSSFIPLTTKGDLLGFGSSNARIPVGTNGQVLTADSAEALGVKWATPSGGGGSGGLTVTPLAAALNPAVNNTYYLTNTSSIAFSVTLPVGASGSNIRFADASNTWDLRNVTLIPATGDIIGTGIANEPLVLNTHNGWADLAHNGTRWVVTTSNVSTVGPASPIISGVVKGGEVPGNSGASAISYPNAGYVNRVTTTTNNVTSAVFFNVASLVLQPGSYDVSAVATMTSNASNVIFNRMVLGTSLQTSGTLSYNDVASNGSVVNATGQATMVIPCVEYNVAPSTTQTVFVVCRVDGSTGVPIAATITARLK